MEELNQTEVSKQEKPSSYSIGGVEGFFAHNRNIILYVLGGIVGIAALWIGYKEFIVKPQEEEAKVEIFKAQRYYEMDSLTFALKGDGRAKGFLYVADEYGATKSGNLAHYYAGTILLRQAKYDEAIEHLESFSSKSAILMPLCLGALGDAYSQKKDYATAADYYKKAARKDNNKFTTPRFLMKAGRTFEETGNFDEAVSLYQEIKDNYAESFEGAMIDKYIGRAKAKYDSSK